jgi:hypothetical protein
LIKQSGEAVLVDLASARWSEDDLVDCEDSDDDGDETIEGTSDEGEEGEEGRESEDEYEAEMDWLEELLENE